MLSGILFSFGLIEGTTKRYPRMWVAGLAAATPGRCFVHREGRSVSGLP